MIIIESPSLEFCRTVDPSPSCVTPSSDHIKECLEFCRDRALTCHFHSVQREDLTWLASVRINQCTFKVGDEVEFFEKKPARKWLAQYILPLIHEALEQEQLETMIGVASTADINFISLLYEHFQACGLPSPEFAYKTHEDTFTCIVTLPLPSQRIVLADFDAWHMRKKSAKAAAAYHAIQWLEKYEFLPGTTGLLSKAQLS